MLYSFLQPEIQTNLIKNHHSTHQPIYCLHPSSFSITFEELHFWQGVCSFTERSSWDRDRLYGKLMGNNAQTKHWKIKPSLLSCFNSQWVNFAFQYATMNFVTSDISSRSNELSVSKSKTATNCTYNITNREIFFMYVIGGRQSYSTASMFMFLFTAIWLLILCLQLHDCWYLLIISVSSNGCASQ